jgi:hypothetical protein
MRWRRTWSGAIVNEQEALRSVMRPVALYLTLLVVTGIVCVVVLAVMYLPVLRLDSAVRDYSGDGVIAVTSRHVINPGYRVDFEVFDLSKPYSAAYALDGLPRLDAPARAGLYFDEISDQVFGIRGGRLAFRLTAGEQVVMEADAPLDDWNFSDQIGINVTYYNYQTQKRSSFALGGLPETGPLVLRVEYAPHDAVDPFVRGHVRLQVGAYE